MLKVIHMQTYSRVKFFLTTVLIELHLLGKYLCEYESVRIGTVKIRKSQNWKLPELEIVRIGNCQNWKLLESLRVQISQLHCIRPK